MNSFYQSRINEEIRSKGMGNMLDTTTIVIITFLIYLLFPCYIGNIGVLLYLIGLPIFIITNIRYWFLWIPLIIVYPIVLYSYKKLAIYEFHRIKILFETPRALRKRIWKISTVATVVLWGLFLVNSDLNSLFVKTQNVPLTIILLGVFGVIIDLYFYCCVRCIFYYLIFPFCLNDEKSCNVVINKLFIIKSEVYGKYRITTLEYCFQYVDDKNIYKTDWMHFKKLLTEKGSSYQYTLYKGPYGVPYLKRGTHLQKEIPERMKENNIEKYAIKRANKYRIKSISVLFTSIISVSLLFLILVINKEEMYYHPHPFAILLVITSISCLYMFVSMNGKHKIKSIPIINHYDIKKRQ